MLWGPSAHSMTQSELGSILQCLTAPEDFESLLQHVAAALDARRPGSAGSSASRSSVSTQMTADVALRCLGERIAPHSCLQCYFLVNVNLAASTVMGQATMCGLSKGLELCMRCTG